MKWTLIYVDDTGSSPQLIECNGFSNPEEAARAADRNQPWLGEFRLVAAVSECGAKICLADSARTGERGMLL